MDYIIVINSINLAVCIFIVYLALNRNRARNFRRMHLEREAIDAARSNIFDDSFYCLRTDDRCFSGYITRK